MIIRKREDHRESKELREEQKDRNEEQAQKKPAKQERKRVQQKRADILSILRYGTVGILLVYVIVLMVKKGDGNAAFSETASAVEDVVNTDKLTKGGSQDLKRLYRLHSGDYEDVLLYYTRETMGVEEVLLIHVRSQNDTEAVEEAIEKRRQAQLANFEGYGAKQVNLLDSSIIKTKGRYVLFVVSPDADRIEKAFNHVV